MRSFPRQWRTLCLLGLSGLAGCQHGHGPLGVDRCADYPPGAVPQPAGTFNCQWQQAQAERAEHDAFVFYQYEWQLDAAALGPFGNRHAAQVAAGLQDRPYPIVIEPSGNAQLDEARRMALYEKLAELNAIAEPNRIIVARPQAEPMYGLEAPIVGRGFIGVGGAGGRGGQAGGFGGGANGGGFGGGGMGGGGFGGGMGGMF